MAPRGKLADAVRRLLGRDLSERFYRRRSHCSSGQLHGKESEILTAARADPGDGRLLVGTKR